ncbi:hypothetical protein FJ978_24855 [Mesorhizobium sp. B1-1-7]|nr:hypothetical protein FJ978_24855 [Mesorhizobium sp. B1-1-7]
MEGRTPLHVVYREQYRGSRYARHLSRDELGTRFRDIMRNLLTVTPNTKIGVHLVDEQNGPVWEKFTHVAEEMQLRYGPWPAGMGRDILQRDHLPNYASNLAKQAVERISALGLRRGDVFIKLGKRIHMERLYLHGQLRIQPASFFSEPNHNQAIRDDELSLSFSFAMVRDDFGKLVRYSPQADGAAEQRLDVRFDAQSDYYLYCLTSSVEPRLVVDFSAEACVVIRDKGAFRDRLRRAVIAHDPELEMHEGPAIYVDPLVPTSGRPFIPLSKYFGYAYQDEYRFCWLPRRPEERLSHIDLEIGSLEDIAELVLLDAD